MASLANSVGITGCHGFEGNEKLSFPVSEQVKQLKRSSMKVQHRRVSKVFNLCKVMDAFQPFYTPLFRRSREPCDAKDH